MKSPYFLPYQMQWLLDESPIKIWEKSRRIGATYVQSYEDVFDILSGKYPDVWFSSADETAAKEYIRYCRMWAKLFTAAAPQIKILEVKKIAGMLQLHFANGKRITALTSNPKAFRSKGGKVVLDEFAHHNSDIELWKAAKPSTLWGYPIRILSTHNGKQSLFYRFIEEIHAGSLSWSLHTTTIHDAVAQGLVETIYGRPATKAEEEDWLAEQRSNCFDDIVWNEEFCCIPVDEKTAFLSYDLIRSCEDAELPVESALDKGAYLFAGIDIGRLHDLTVIYVLEKIQDIYFSRAIRVLKAATFSEQNSAITNLLTAKNVRRCCIDATGIGMNLAEDMAKRFSRSRVEPVLFTIQKKEELAYLLKRNLENHSIILPADSALRDDLHAVTRETSQTLHAKFSAGRHEDKGHADRFWALALALSAGENTPGKIITASRRCRRDSSITKGYL